MGASVFIYTLGHGLATMASPDCVGWECEEVECKPGYAVKTPDGFLPCESFDEYIETENKELLR